MLLVLWVSFIIEADSLCHAPPVTSVFLFGLAECGPMQSLCNRRLSLRCRSLVAVLTLQHCSPGPSTCAQPSCHHHTIALPPHEHAFSHSLPPYLIHLHFCCCGVCCVLCGVWCVSCVVCRVLCGVCVCVYTTRKNPSFTPVKWYLSPVPQGNWGTWSICSTFCSLRVSKQTSAALGFREHSVPRIQQEMDWRDTETFLLYNISTMS